MMWRSALCKIGYLQGTLVNIKYLYCCSIYSHIPLVNKHIKEHVWNMNLNQIMPHNVFRSSRLILVLIILIIGTASFIWHNSNNVDLMQRRFLLRNKPLNYCKHIQHWSKGKYLLRVSV